MLRKKKSVHRWFENLDVTGNALLFMDGEALQMGKGN